MARRISSTSSVKSFVFICNRRSELFTYQQNRTLVNVKLKWVKDENLDSVVAADKNLRPANTLASIISSAPNQSLPIYRLRPHRGQLGLPKDLKLAAFLRRFPTVFRESAARDSAGTRVPCFGLTQEALELQLDGLHLVEENRVDLLNRLKKLLMLVRDRVLPLQTLDQLKWDLGLPYDFQDSFLPRHPGVFSLVELPDGRVGLRLQARDHVLAVSELRRSSGEAEVESCLAFPIRFTRGFGLRRKSMEWLREWQKLPYTCPYGDASGLDPRTDVSEKRIVGVFHELLHLTLQKKTERRNVSNLRGPLALPQKFTKVFERHPGIFYLSEKGGTQTVVLREGYDGRRMVQRPHPIVENRERFARMLQQGVLDRSRGLYKRNENDGVDEEEKEAFDSSSWKLDIFGLVSDDEFASAYVSDYDSDHSMSSGC